MAIDIYFIFGVCSLFVSALTIVGHSMTIHAFRQVPNLTTNPSNLFILALSAVDLIFGLNIFFYYAIPNTFGLGNPFGEIGCLLSVFLDDVYITGNFLLVAISVDRVMLVSMDYSKYMKSQTKIRIKLVIGLCCAIGFLNAVIEVALWGYAKSVNEAAANIDFDAYCVYPARRMKWFSLYITFGVYCPPVFIVGILSVVFLIFLRRRMQKSTRIGSEVRSAVRSNAGRSDGNGGRSDGGSTGRSDGGGEGERDVMRNRYLKPAITLGALVTAMTISMLPLCIYLVIEAFADRPNNYNLVYIMWFIYELNPCLDAVFYAATQRSIKEYYWQKSVRLCKRNR